MDKKLIIIFVLVSVVALVMTSRATKKQHRKTGRRRQSKYYGLERDIDEQHMIESGEVPQSSSAVLQKHSDIFG